MKVVALLPMKGQSERVPNKNMRMFNGSPLCAVMLEKLTSTRSISNVLVNTDSIQIKTFISQHFPKVQVIDRPAALVGHDVSMNKIIQHDIDILDADVYIQTHTTNPLLRISSIEDAIAEFTSGLDFYDSLFSVTKYQTRFYDKDGVAINHDPKVLIKTQDLPILYEENSCIYLFKKDVIKQTGRRIGRVPRLYEIDAMEAVDIDVESEFLLAEKLFKVI